MYGKSSIFNNLTGLNQHTGNWTGKTIENATGMYKFKEKKVLLFDIPGTYSLMSDSPEEEIARNYICFNNPDVIVVVVDATCLERNLNLVYQIMEITDKIVICVNLLDEANKKGIKVDLNKLSEMLGVPVVGTIANKKSTLYKLIEIVDAVHYEKIVSKPKKVIYDNLIESAVNILSEVIEDTLGEENKRLTRWICLKLIDGNDNIIHTIEEKLNINLKNNKIIALKINEAKIMLLKNNINKERFKEKVTSLIIKKAEKVRSEVCKINNINYNERDRKIDKIITSKKFGIPIMLVFLILIFWITIEGANYPSELLSNLFEFLCEKLHLLFETLDLPIWFSGIVIDGMIKTTGWVISVMLPPMIIFFPLFTLLEDLGFLPRIAFNLDYCFKKCLTTGKQALTMCMGFGCNACGVTGCRIINSEKERIIAILTNAFVPCNGRFPFLITVAMIFFGGIFSAPESSIISTIVVVLIILFGMILSMLISRILAKTILKKLPSSSFVLELPPYRKPKVCNIIVRSILDKTLLVLGRAISVAAPTGIVIWLFANINIGDMSILIYIANFLDPFAKLMGLDGYIITGFILGIPANEIVLPIILMCYMANGTLINIEDTNSIGEILISNGWNALTAINVMIFTLLHFPCGTTLLTIKKETHSLKYTLLAFLLPTICGITICLITNGIWNLLF